MSGGCAEAVRLAMVPGRSCRALDARLLLSGNGAAVDKPPRWTAK